MRTLFSIIALVILGNIVKMILPFVLVILNFPGKWIAFPNTSGQSSKPGLMFGILVTVLLQSCVYLAYTAFVVNWTVLAMEKKGVGFIVLFAALFAVLFPMAAVQRNVGANMDAEERSYRKRLNEFAQNKANERGEKLMMDAKSTWIVFLVTLVGFVVFAFFPRSMEMLYGWIPFHAFHYPVQ
jgi:hypothetical protein